MARDSKCTIENELENSLDSTLNSLNRMLSVRESLSESLKLGWFQITCARYSSASNSITQLQYDESDQNAFSTICMSHHPSLHVMTERSKNDQAFDLHHPCDVDDQSRSSYWDGSDLQRSIPNYIFELESEETEAGGSMKTEGIKGDDGCHGKKAKIKQKEKVLRWFGALVPPPLRVAQSSFIAALQMCVDLANQQTHFVQSQHRFMALKQKPKQAS